MKLEVIKYFQYSYHFSTPFITSQKTYNFRNGFILKVQDSSGNIGFGEAAPLDGYGEESLIEAKNSIDNLVSLLNNITFIDFEELQNKLSEENISNSVIAAIMFAVLQIYNSNAEIKNDFFNKYNFTKTIHLNGVIGFGDLSEIIQKVNSLVTKGFRVIKIKIGRKVFNDDLKIINAINDLYPEIKLRLDVNGKWNFAEALINIEKLNRYNIEYIEDPISGIKDLIKLSDELHKNSDLNIAIDEPMQNYSDAKNIITNTNLNYVIIKPSLVGGVFRTLELQRLASQNNKTLIISSALESSLGRYQNAIIAALINNNSAHGIDTTNFLQNDLSENFYIAKNNFLELDFENFPKIINDKLC